MHYQYKHLHSFARPRSPDMATRNEIRPGWKSHSTTEALIILLRAIRLFVPLSETEYNDNCQDQYSCSCQNSVVYASHTEYRRLMCSTSCPVSFHVSFTIIQRNTKQPEHFTTLVHASVSEELEVTMCIRTHGL